jgi:hypothetical protein
LKITIQTDFKFPILILGPNSDDFSTFLIYNFLKYRGLFDVSTHLLINSALNKNSLMLDYIQDFFKQ